MQRCLKGEAMTKFRIYFDKDKEVTWLNEMAAKGWAMTGFSFCAYHFEPCAPGEYLYQVDFGGGAFSVSEDYREFMSEAGVEIVSVWGPYVFLRRKAGEGSFELYTDVESKVEQYTKIRAMLKVAFILELSCLILEVLAGLGGSPMGWVAVFFILAVMMVFIRQIVRISGILAELKERLGGGSEAVGELYRVKGDRNFAGAWAFVCCAVMAVWVLAESLLHELGHCVAVWISGGKVTGFYPYFGDAHVTFEGIADSPFINVSGSLLPVLAALAVLLFYKRSERFPRLNVLAGVFCTLICSLLEWVVVPLAYMFGFYDPTDDITKFLNGTGFHPVATALAAAFCFGILWTLFLKKLSVFFGQLIKEKKTFIRISSTITFILCIVGLLATMFSGMPEGNVAGRFRFTTGSGQQSILQEEHGIEIKNAGKYVVEFDCRISRGGVLAAVALCDDETGYFFSTGETFLSVESEPLDLRSGSYTLSVYCITDEEEWEEFRRIVGRNAKDASEMGFPYQETDEVTVTGSYWIRPVPAE